MILLHISAQSEAVIYYIKFTLKNDRLCYNKFLKVFYTKCIKLSSYSMAVKLYYPQTSRNKNSFQFNRSTSLPTIPYTPSKLCPYFSCEIVVTLQFGKNQSLEREREKKKRKYRDFTLWRTQPIIQ
ncbi:hypothetical protein CEXT_2631 [Caerostris extrusa]|uniref:Uncharacterized protein n=1 Tax=Caerostris extrusa TaxID=172846 RepID=A0AAV4R5Z8_CAEEX|nr:hypothetical protein CEXT_2631 [Caerostris extrusa]